MKNEGEARYVVTLVILAPWALPDLQPVCM